MKRALILDLDNTIYPVSSIADHLFSQLFNILDEHLNNENNHVDRDKINNIKAEMTRKPFQQVAEQFQLDIGLRSVIVEALNNMTYDFAIQPFTDYEYIRAIPIEKFLVTTGFLKLQLSKIKMLNIAQDFKEIRIVDPETSNHNKKDAFIEIMEKHGYSAPELLVIGDDPDSEIKMANELGIDTFLYDPKKAHPYTLATCKSGSLKDVILLL